MVFYWTTLSCTNTVFSISSQTLYNIHNTRLYIRFNKRSLESSFQRWRSRLITAQRIYNIYRINRERRIAFHIRFAWDRTMMAINHDQVQRKKRFKVFKASRATFIRNVPVLSARDSRRTKREVKSRICSKIWESFLEMPINIFRWKQHVSIYGTRTLIYLHNKDTALLSRIVTVSNYSRVRNLYCDEKPRLSFHQKCHNRAKRSHEALCVTVVDDSRLLDV